MGYLGYFGNYPLINVLDLQWISFEQGKIIIGFFLYMKMMWFCFEFCLSCLPKVKQSISLWSLDYSLTWIPSLFTCSTSLVVSILFINEKIIIWVFFFFKSLVNKDLKGKKKKINKKEMIVKKGKTLRLDVYYIFYCF